MDDKGVRMLTARDTCRHNLPLSLMSKTDISPRTSFGGQVTSAVEQRLSSLLVTGLLHETVPIRPWHWGAGIILGRFRIGLKFYSVRDLSSVCHPKHHLFVPPLDLARY